MGAETALLIYADGDVAQALHDAVEVDRAATEALVARLVPGSATWLRWRTAVWIRAAHQAPHHRRHERVLLGRSGGSRWSLMQKVLAGVGSGCCCS
jgi:hypothetical protein